MNNVCLVTGANGHLGNNLVRALIAKGYRVRAGVRNLDNLTPFEGLDCEMVRTELQDKESMRKALTGVDVFYQVAAVFKHWAKDPVAEIISPNINGTKIALEAAAEVGVKKIVYVSSVAAVGHNGQRGSESEWNDDLSNPYYQSKILSEQQAWKTATDHKLWMVSILPSAMIGPNAYTLTDTMNYLELVRKKQLPLNPNFHFNFIDVRDVADAAIVAANQGRSGQRYILANNHSSDLNSIIRAVNLVKSGYSMPLKAPKWLLFCAAWLNEITAQFTNKRPQLTVSQVRLFYGCKQEFNTEKARLELGFIPREPGEALRETFSYLENRGA